MESDQEHSPSLSENFGFEVRFNTHDLKEIRFVLPRLGVEVLLRRRARAFRDLHARNPSSMRFYSVSFGADARP